MVNNITTVTFPAGQTRITAPTYLWQWDYGQILKVEGLELPEAYQVHFCAPGDATTVTVLGNADGVAIPDSLLLTGKKVIAYIYLHTGEDDGETEYQITIMVLSRPQPTDIEPTPEEQALIDQLIAALNAGVEEAEEAVEHYPKIVSGYWYVWSNGNWVNTGVSAEGPEGVSPEVTIASITGGHSVTITDADHPSGQTFNVMDGESGEGIAVAVSGTTPSITAEANHRYICGTLDELTFTPPVSGVVDVVFTSGTTPTVLNLPNTVKMPEWFEVESNRIYEINIADGVFGAVMSWATA